MHAFEDNDMKIFGAKAEDINETDVLMRVVELMKKQRANGNVERAKELGEYVARKIYSPENIDLPVQDAIRRYRDNEVIYEQIKMLITFAAEAGIHVLLEKYSVSTMAVNALYDELIKLDNDLYDNITNAFTYYYLVIRKGGDINYHMGYTFAKLCKEKDNEELMKLGTEIYTSIQVKLKEEIDSKNFVND